MLKHIEVDPTKTIDASKYTYYRFPYERFNPLQSAYFTIHNLGGNAVITASTSAGKTVIAEMQIFKTLHEGGTAVYIVPLRALAYEKHQKWSKVAGINVISLTGDAQKGTKSKLVSGQLKSTLIIITSEMMDAICKKPRKYRKFLDSIISVIVDEAHLISYPKRGPALEYVIIKLLALRQSPRMILLSATMSNAEEIAQWIDSLSGNNTYVINSNWSPCKVEHHYIEYVTYRNKRLQADEITNKIGAILEDSLYGEDKSKKVLIFCHSVDMSRVIAKALQEKYMTDESMIASYNSSMSKSRRESLLKLFNMRDGGIMVLASTSGLAWGVNTPARYVIIVGVKRNTELVDVMDLRQMAGRAGRVGIHDRGDVYVLVPSLKYSGILDGAMVVSSKLDDMDYLSFHVLSEIHNGARTKDQIMQNFIKKTLAFRQHIINESVLDEALDYLFSKALITIENGIIKTTYLGRISCYLYYMPDIVSTMNNNFSMIYDSVDALEISWALGNAMEPAYPPADIRDDTELYKQSLEEKCLRFRAGREAWGYCFYLLLTGRSARNNLYYQIKADRERLSLLTGALYTLNKRASLLCGALILLGCESVTATSLALRKESYKKSCFIIKNTFRKNEHIQV